MVVIAFAFINFRPQTLKAFDKEVQTFCVGVNEYLAVIVGEHRKNMIGYFKNRLDWSSIARIRIEKIRHLRTGRRRTRYLDSFVYHDFFGSLKSTAERRGVLVEEVAPAYTSQRCSCCGWTRKRNRKGRRFECGVCGFATDADFNASLNISLDLRPIGAGERLKRPNLAGFYWRGRCDSGQEPVVPVVRKLPNSCFS
jgi:hypothetical protein